MDTELQDSALAKGGARNGAHILGVLNGNNHTSGQSDLLPGLVEVEDVSAIRTTLEDVRLHLEVGVLRANVGIGHEELGNILLSVKSW